MLRSTHPVTTLNQQVNMQRLLISLGIVIGSYLGWWLGAKLHGGIMTRFTLSSLLSMVGVYVGWRINRDLL